MKSLPLTQVLPLKDKHDGGKRRALYTKIHIHTLSDGDIQTNTHMGKGITHTDTHTQTHTHICSFVCT